VRMCQYLNASSFFSMVSNIYIFVLGCLLTCVAIDIVFSCYFGIVFAPIRARAEKTLALINEPLNLNLNH